MTSIITTELERVRRKDADGKDEIEKVLEEMQLLREDLKGQG